MIQKPGIPSGTPTWLKAMIETIIGRRGGRTRLPELQTLTFSATPTKAECEALNAYVNEWGKAMKSMVERIEG